ncbi:MAG: lipoyl domain-containing protein [Blastomonas fulva]|uniref:lipoyl domain-containing protein n=1 Tax=Blastomonas fulva TaxID=1550728 RepID=UPI00403364B1
MAKITLKVPKGAVSMQNGTIVEWFVSAGDVVSVGQLIYAIETEKTTIEVESPFPGTITPIAEQGQTLPVGAPVATIEN